MDSFTTTIILMLIPIVGLFTTRRNSKHSTDETFNYHLRIELNSIMFVFIFISCYFFEISLLYHLKSYGIFIYYSIFVLYFTLFTLYALLCLNLLSKSQFILALNVMLFIDLISKLLYLVQGYGSEIYNTQIILVTIRVIILSYLGCRYLTYNYNQKQSDENKQKGTYKLFVKVLKLFVPHYATILIKDNKIKIFIFILSTIFQRLINYYNPIFLKRSIDLIENNINRKDLNNHFWDDYYIVFFPFLITSFINRFNIIFLLHHSLLESINGSVRNYISTLIFDKTICLPYDYHINNNCRETLGSLLNIVYELEYTLNNIFLKSGINLIDYSISLYIYYSEFGFNSLLILLCGTGIRIISNYILTNKKGKVERKQINSRQVLGDIINDNVRGFDIIKMYVGEKQESNRYKESLKQGDDYSKWLKSYRSIKIIIDDFIRGITFGLCATLCIYQVYNNSKTAGQFIYFTSFFYAVFYASDGIFNIHEQIHSIGITCEKILDIMEIPLSFDLNTIPNPIQPLKECAIEFRNVYFSYPEKATIINNISFKLNKGKTLAIVGSSGNGKSTLVKLMNKFYLPTSGDIFINGQNIVDLDERTVRSYLGVVPQSLSLFNETIMYNIKYGKPSATDEEAIKVAKITRIHDMISSQPDGYDTKVGGSGLTLSGGEMQRLALARVFLKNAPILILDEATSSLDNIMEKSIHHIIHTLSQQSQTIIIIAHRLTTITHADTIICLKDGKVYEQGTHEELLDLKGEYFKLWNLKSDDDS